jgi:NTP pyrophosphatase (non-canonical NTP hydrolase)
VASRQFSHRPVNLGQGCPTACGRVAAPGGTLPAMKKTTSPRRARVKKLDSLPALIAEVRRFRDERDWSQFHTPKNLAAAIAIEAAELQEQFLWKTDKEIERNLKEGPKRDAVIEEIADVLMFALLLADRLDINVGKAITDKLAANEKKYPVALARGNARKYTELHEP